VTPLRRRMLEDMRIRNFSAATQQTYVYQIAQFAKRYGKSPEYLGLDELHNYRLYLLDERKLSPQTVNGFVAAAKFLYVQTLEMPWGDEQFPRCRVAEKLPVVLTAEEVERFFAAVGVIKHRAVVMLCYGSGLRIAEAVSLRAEDIDGRRMLIHVREGKGFKDRYTVISQRMLDVLRQYWKIQRPQNWLFPGSDPDEHIHPASIRKMCRDACHVAGITKRVTPHTLRHSFATHLLENGTETRVIQVLLGHRRIDTTARYVSVSPRCVSAVESPLDHNARTVLNTSGGKKKVGRPRKNTADAIEKQKR
jgi:integrase/recombinase XerD